MLLYLYLDIHCCRGYIKIYTVAALIPRYLIWLYLYLDILLWTTLFLDVCCGRSYI
jgi:hypothetical protein